MLPHQFLLFASQWTAGIERFVRTYMPDGLILISSQAEAAVFGQVRQVRLIPGVIIISNVFLGSTFTGPVQLQVHTKITNIYMQW